MTLKTNNSRGDVSITLYSEEQRQELQYLNLQTQTLLDSNVCTNVCFIIYSKYVFHHI